MFKHKCESSNIEHIDYNATENILEVKFKSGGTYHYSNVDQKAYEAFKNAKSHGSHFAKTINGKFTHKKHEPKKEETK